MRFCAADAFNEDRYYYRVAYVLLHNLLKPAFHVINVYLNDGYCCDRLADTLFGMRYHFDCKFCVDLSETRVSCNAREYWPAQTPVLCLMACNRLNTPRGVHIYGRTVDMVVLATYKNKMANEQFLNHILPTLADVPTVCAFSDDAPVTIIS